MAVTSISKKVFIMVILLLIAAFTGLFLYSSGLGVYFLLLFIFGLPVSLLYITAFVYQNYWFSAKKIDYKPKNVKFFKICIYCQNKILIKAQYCPYCGTKQN
jgi:hypothetical protein